MKSLWMFVLIGLVAFSPVVLAGQTLTQSTACAQAQNSDDEDCPCGVDSETGECLPCEEE